jgi:hypothetical protein
LCLINMEFYFDFLNLNIVEKVILLKTGVRIIYDGEYDVVADIDVNDCILRRMGIKRLQGRIPLPNLTRVHVFKGMPSIFYDVPRIVPGDVRVHDTYRRWNDTTLRTLEYIDPGRYVHPSTFRCLVTRRLVDISCMSATYTDTKWCVSSALTSAYLVCEGRLYTRDHLTEVRDTRRYILGSWLYKEGLRGVSYDTWVSAPWTLAPWKVTFFDVVSCRIDLPYSREIVTLIISQDDFKFSTVWRTWSFGIESLINVATIWRGICLAIRSYEVIDDVDHQLSLL